MELKIPPDAENLLRSKASAAGMDVGQYVIHLVHLDEPDVEYDDEELYQLALEGLASGLSPREASDFDVLKANLIREYEARQNEQ